MMAVLSVALAAYMMLVPADSVAGVGKRMPKWVVNALTWSESHGWAQRGLFDQPIE